MTPDALFRNGDSHPDAPTLLCKEAGVVFKGTCREVERMGALEGKKLLLLGERDGIAGPAMEEVLKESGAEIVFSATECFV